MQHLYSSCHVFVRNNRYEWPPSLFLFLSNISLIKLLTDTHKFTNRSSYIKNESTKHLQFINKWVICLCWHLRIYHQSKVCKLHFLKNCKIVNFQQDCQFIQDVKLWISNVLERREITQFNVGFSQDKEKHMNQMRKKINNVFHTSLLYSWSSLWMPKHMACPCTCI